MEGSRRGQGARIIDLLVKLCIGQAEGAQAGRAKLLHVLPGGVLDEHVGMVGMIQPFIDDGVSALPCPPPSVHGLTHEQIGSHWKTRRNGDQTLQNSMILPSGLRTMVDIRLRVLSNSRMFKISNSRSTCCPGGPSRTYTAVLVRL